MDYFISSLFTVVAAFYAGWVLRKWFLLMNMSERPDYFIDILKEVKRLNAEQEQAKDKPDTDAIKVECHQGQYYLFTLDKDEFVGQGSSIAEAMEQAAKRFPGRKFRAAESNELHQTA